MLLFVHSISLLTGKLQVYVPSWIINTAIFNYKILYIEKYPFAWIYFKKDFTEYIVFIFPCQHPHAALFEKRGILS